ncbi:hypothetical protein B0E47_01575 [Rhodanobacter sp. B05]|uniref:hypothetical protein n=1 Tax=Rhodanobacter sp. B05 TaxID=1945859 RepID=UPI0009847A04|nr:hypothetical protein [Rhodanobacter sp. B05]OOG60828.1 hypothetical protein B0E47_01575 [Rhodanobacter sp. B05]
MCHLSIHTGIAEILGIRADVESHIFLLTMWGKREMKRHMKEAGEKWERLSRIWWDIDVTVASRAGLTLYSKEELWWRVNDKRRKATEQSESRCLMIDGYACDYSEQLTDGFVVFIPDTDEQTLDGLPVSGGISVDYWCKNPALIDPEKSRIALKTYMQAYRRPYGIGSDEALTEALKDRSQPRRLVMTENVNVTHEMLDEGLRDGIIFSWAS